MWKFNLGGGSKTVPDATESASAEMEAPADSVDTAKLLKLRNSQADIQTEFHADPRVEPEPVAVEAVLPDSITAISGSLDPALPVITAKRSMGPINSAVTAKRKPKDNIHPEVEGGDTWEDMYEEDFADDEEDDEDEGDVGEENDGEVDEEEDGSTETSGSFSSDSESEDRDSIKHYPIFSEAYAERCNYGMVPFLRVEHVQPSAGSFTGSGADPEDEEKKKSDPDLVLYGEYVYEKTLGKGTYSKVVLARLRNSGSQNGQGPCSPDAIFPAIGASSDPSLGSFLSGYKLNGNKVALKIFRNKEAYREACWEEMVILSLLCGLSGVPTLNTNGGGSGAGMGEYVASLARFAAPISYIPHPSHPALVLPLLGPSTFAVCRRMKQASRDIAEKENYDTHKSPRNKPAIWYRGFPLPLLKSVLYQVLIFLQYSHSKGIVHTDLKPENVLFESAVLSRSVVPIYYQEVKRLDTEGGDKENGSPDEENTEKNGPGKKAATEECEGAPPKAMIKNEANSLRENSRFVEGMENKYPFFSPFSNEGGRTEISFAHNVIVTIPVLPSIRVVDFGAAQLISRFRHTSRIDRSTLVSYERIQTKHYISPEVLLCTGWSASADIFSLGCMIPELLTSDCLFMPQNRTEHLALMEHIICPFAEEDVSKYRSGRRFIDEAFICNPQSTEMSFDPRTNALRWPITPEVLQDRMDFLAQCESGYNSHNDSSENELELTTEDDIKYVNGRPTLDEILGPLPALLDLTRKMLAYHPLERITASEALRHPFFQTM